MFLGIISSFGITLLSIFYLSLLIYSLILIFKSEIKLYTILWTLFVLLIPLVGSLVYILRYFTLKLAKN